MKAGFAFVSAILIVDTFFVSYFLGLHSHTVDVEDPSMKPVVKPVPPKPAAQPKAEKPAESKATTKKAKPSESSKHKGTKPKQAAKKQHK